MNFINLSPSLAMIFCCVFLISAETCSDTGDDYCSDIRTTLTNCVDLGCLPESGTLCSGQPDTDTCYVYAVAMRDNPSTRLDYTVWMRLCCALYYPPCTGAWTDGSPVTVVCYDSCVNGYVEVGYPLDNAQFQCEMQISQGRVLNATAPECTEVVSFASDSYCESVQSTYHSSTSRSSYSNDYDSSVVNGTPVIAYSGMTLAFFLFFIVILM